ncbi:hypothetical protein BZG13_10455 [Salinivibrio sp. ML323]|nr:hypothetical protein BZG13_10455 [Salinivibrio sp. ML323]
MVVWSEKYDWIVSSGRDVAMKRQFLLTVSLVFLLSACQSVKLLSRQSPIDETNQGSAQRESIEAYGTAQEELMPKPVKFELQSTITDSQLSSISEKYDTIDIQEFKLKEHLLHRVEFQSSVLFGLDKSNLEMVDISEISQFATTYSSGEPSYYLLIVGHTDSTGSRTYNQALSTKRALKIAELLHTSGVSESQIKLIPAGEIYPAHTNTSQHGRQLNRRVELLVAKSRELVKSFIRQRDCTDIDPACTRALLPIMDVYDSDKGLVLDTKNSDSVVTQTPEINELAVLAKSLSNDILKTDKRYETKSERERIEVSAPSVREPLEVPTLVRPVLDFVTETRKPLKLPKKYHLKANQ